MSAKKLYQIILCNSIGIALFLSWYLPVDHGFWSSMDRAVFFYFNQHLAESRFFLYFVAFTNFRAFDLVAGACMLLILLYYFFQQNSEGKRRIICIFITMALSTVAVKLLDRQLDFHRLSPTLYFTNMHEPVNFVSEMTGWNVKDSSTASFPGDHGAMLLIFTAFLARYFGRKACLAGMILCILFSLPRIMSDAHWFTDVAVGSLSLVLLSMSWVLLTPAANTVIKWLEAKLFFPNFKNF